MVRWWSVVLLVGAVLCAGIGVALVVGPLGAPRFGWTAYAPLSRTAYVPDLTWLIWKPRVGAVLIALGAGTTGAVAAAAAVRRPRRRDRTAARSRTDA